MNEHCIKLTGKFSIPQALDIDKSYDIRLKGGIVSISKQSQENGEFEFTYKLVPEFGEVEKDNGEIVKIQDTKKQSVKLRIRIALEAEQEGKNSQVEYDHYMILLRHFWPEVKNFLEGLENI